MSTATPSGGRNQSIFASYVALAKGLVGDLSGVGLLNAALKPVYESGELPIDAFGAWVRSLHWSRAGRRVPAARAGTDGLWWVAIPVEKSDGALLGVFAASQQPAAPPAQPARFAGALAARLKPLIDCIHRDMAAALPARSRAKDLTDRAAELEWLFQVTSNLKGAVDDKRVLEDLLAASTARLDSALGILYVPDKRLTVTFAQDRAAAATLLVAWEQTRPHLITWVQRQNRPLMVNSVGNGSANRTRCKVLCVPVVRDTGRVTGALAFYKLPEQSDFVGRHVFLARHLGRQAASIVEAQFDLTTGLYTRSGLDQMYRGFAEADDFAERSIIYVDIDYMRVANELHGFELGNELIVRVADLLAAPVLPEDALAARISGDRFVIILPKASTVEAVEIAKQLQKSVAQLTIGPSKEVFDVSISCGVGSLLPLPEGLARGIASAELACKTAKQRGRNRVELYAFEDRTMMRSHQDALAVGQLRSALKADRLLLYAQRIAPLKDPAAPGGYEILLRLKEADGSLVTPGPLIEAAQRYQILPSIDRWVVQQAMQMLGPHRTMLKTRGLTMSINVSGQSIGDEAFIQQFTRLLKEANLPRDCISVELTEQAAITNLPRAREMVSRVRALGCAFALDDFGTGANSLTYLKALQVSRVKIDGSFVRDIMTDRNSQATVRAIVELAKGLGIETVAEFVESDTIANKVRELGVDFAQGFAIRRPEPLSDLLDLLTSDESQKQHRLLVDT